MTWQEPGLKTEEPMKSATYVANERGVPTFTRCIVDYIKQLIEVLRVVEQEEILENLHALFSIIQTIRKSHCTSQLRYSNDLSYHREVWYPFPRYVLLSGALPIHA